MNRDSIPYARVSLCPLTPLRYDLPVRITNNKGCPTPQCNVDLGPNCPAPLKGPFDSTGFPLGCKSACAANLDGNPTDSANCCSGSHNVPATCPASGVQYYSYFKQACPNAYAASRLLQLELTNAWPK